MPLERSDKPRAIMVINRDPRLNNSNRRIAIELIDRCNFETLRCDPGMATLSRDLGIQKRQISRSLKQLHDFGYFRYMRHGGGNLTNYYYLNWAGLAQASELNREASDNRIAPPIKRVSEVLFSTAIELGEEIEARGGSVTEVGGSSKSSKDFADATDARPKEVTSRTSGGCHPRHRGVVPKDIGGDVTEDIQTSYSNIKKNCENKITVS